MSAVSASTSPDLFQVLQSLSQNATGSSSSSVSSLANPSIPSIDSNDAADSTGQTDSTGKGHHHHHGVSSKIESAVASALQNSDGTEDPNQVVKDAIAGVLQPGAGGATGAGGGSPTAGGAAGGSNAASLSPAAFQQLLQSYGINSQQFQQDLQSAVGGSQGGNGGSSSVNFATLFKSFPPGSAIETTG